MKELIINISENFTFNKLLIIVPWLFAFLTLLISYLTIKTNSKIAILNVNKTVLSGNRQVWIHNLRDSVSEYIALHIALEQQVYDNEKQIDSLRELTLLQTKIALSLNPNEEDNENLVLEIFKITKPKSKRPEIDSSEVIAKIMVLTQKILKKEWERVKAIE